MVTLKELLEKAKQEAEKKVAQLQQSLVSSAKSKAATEAKKTAKIIDVAPKSVVPASTPKPVDKNSVLYIGPKDEAKPKVSPLFVPNTTIRPATQAESQRMQYNDFWDKPSVGKAFDFAKRVTSDFGDAVGKKLGQDTLDARIAAAPNDEERKKIIMGNVGIGSLPARMAQTIVPGAAQAAEGMFRPAAEAIQDFGQWADKGIRGNEEKLALDLGRYDEYKNKDIISGLTKGTKAAYETALLLASGGLLKGAGAASKVVPFLSSVGKARTFGNLVQLAPEDIRDKVGPALDIYNIATSPEKKVAALSAALGNTVVPWAQKKINESGLSPELKEAAGVGVGLGSDLLAGYAGGSKLFTKAKPYVAPSAEVKGYTNIGEGIDPKSLKQTNKVPEQSNLFNEPDLDAAAKKNSQYAALHDEINSIADDQFGGSGIVNKKAKDILAMGIDFSKLKDKKNKVSYSAAKLGTLDEGMQKAFGDQYVKVRPILEAFDKSKLASIVRTEGEYNKMNQNVVQDLGIKARTRDSALTQAYGEKLLTDKDLAILAPNRITQIKAADQFFRKAYNDFLPELNRARDAIYPGNKDKQIGNVTDYYHHAQGQARTFLGKLVQAAKHPEDISPEVAGLSADTQPNARFNPMAQHRTLELDRTKALAILLRDGQISKKQLMAVEPKAYNEIVSLSRATGKDAIPTTFDAVTGYREYVPQAMSVIHIDPHISTLRALAKVTAAEMGTNTNANNFIRLVREQANGLAGKRQSLDRSLAETLGPIHAIYNVVADQAKKNAVVGNISTAIKQIASAPLAVAKLKTYALRGQQTAFWKLQEKSPFLRERYSTAGQMFDRGPVKTTMNKVGNTLGLLEEAQSRAIWSGAYKKAVDEGASNPIFRADQIAKEIIGGRGKLDKPVLFMDRTLNNSALAFQLEVNNQARQLYKMGKQGDITGLAAYSVMAYLTNQIISAATGQENTVFDPISAALDSYDQIKDDEEGTPFLSKAATVAKRAGGEVIASLPGAQAALQVFMPNDYQRKATFGDLAGRGMYNPFSNLNSAAGAVSSFLFPGGGAQIKKGAEGIAAVARGYGTDSKGNVIPQRIDQTIGNYIQSGLFGKGTLDAYKNYYNGEISPLSAADSRVAQFKSPSEQEKIFAAKESSREFNADRSGKREGIARQFASGDYNIESVKDSVNQFLNDYSAPTQAQIEEKRQTDKWKNASPEVLNKEITRQNRRSLYSSVSSAMIEDIRLYGADPANREDAKEKLKEVLDSQRRLLYNNAQPGTQDYEDYKEHYNKVVKEVKLAW